MATHSALIGSPPATDEDYYIVKGFHYLIFSRLKAIGQLHGAPPPIHPEKGSQLAHRPPPNLYHFEDRGGDYLTAACTAIAIMVLVTGARLAIRARNAKLYFGADDWLILVGVVRLVFSS